MSFGLESCRKSSTPHTCDAGQVEDIRFITPSTASVHKEKRGYEQGS